MKKLLVLFLLLLPVVYADIGPKPSTDIYVNYYGQPVEEPFYARMLDCGNDFNRCDLPPEECKALNITHTDSECTWTPSPLAWGGSCQNSLCNFHYMLPDRFKLAIHLNDKVYLTNTVDRTQFKSSYLVEITDKAILTESSPLFDMRYVKFFLIAFILTIVIELILASAVIFAFKLKKKTLLYVLLANLVTIPVVWFVIPVFQLNTLFIPLAELFAFGFEGWFFYRFAKIKKSRAFVLSFIINLFSYLAGTIAFFIFYFV